MCYLQGSSIGVTMIKTSYFLYKSPNASSDAFNSSIPQEIQFLSPVFWSLPFSDSWWTSIILPELHLDLSRSDCHHCDLQAETCVFARLCKLCAWGALYLPKQSQPRNLWNGHGVPCQTLPSAKSTASEPWTCSNLSERPWSLSKNPKQVQLSRV